MEEENGQCLGCHNSGVGFGWHAGEHPVDEVACAVVIGAAVVVVTEEGGATASQSVTFEVVGFASEFISDPESVRTTGATVSSCHPR